MKAKAITTDQAIEMIKSKRAKASPNGGFLRQLKAYEQKLANEWIIEFIL